MTIPLNVLMIEDEENDALLLALKLRENGYEPALQRVETPETLRRALDDKVWDVIISDHHMPRFSAPDALRVVRESGLDVPFIIISGKIDEEMAVEAMKVGAHDYLSKNNLTRLVPVIEREMREAVYRRERRQNAAALRDSEAIFRTVVNAAADAIIMIDKHGLIELFNHAAEAMFGYSAGEVIRQNVDILIGEELVRTGVGRTRELTAQRKDGSIFPIDLSVSETQIGEQVVLTAIIRDITERKHAEAEKLQTELERLEVQKEREIVELKARFIQMITHEFRNPLSVIFSSCEILTIYHDRLTVEKRLERVKVIQDRTQYMVSLLNDTLEMAQGNAGMLPFNPKPVNLEAVVMTLFEQVQMSATTHHEYALEISGALDPVIADDKLLESILSNLLTNAIKYTPEGGAITLRVEGRADEIVFEVTDTGIGIPLDDQPRIFEPFHRAGNVDDIEGTGLGLPIVKNAVIAHGGEIGFTSKQDAGTTFTVRLPRL